MPNFYEKNKIAQIGFADNQELDKAIKRVHMSSAKIGPMIHAVLVACVQHAVAHKDASKLTALVSGLPNSINKKNGLDIWISKYTSLAWGKNTLGVGMYLGKDKVYTFILEGIENPFYDMPEVKKANTPLTDESLFAAIKGLIAKAGKEGVQLSDNGKAFVDTLATTFEQFAQKPKAKA